MSGDDALHVWMRAYTVRYKKFCIVCVEVRVAVYSKLHAKNTEIIDCECRPFFCIIF